MNDFITQYELEGGFIGLRVDSAAFASLDTAAHALRDLLDIVRRADVSGACVSFVESVESAVCMDDLPSKINMIERYDAARHVQRLLRELETQGKPVAAVIDAPVEGLGVALALACHWRVGPAADDTAFAASERMTPGVTARAVHTAGVLAAAEWLVEGHSLSGARAHAQGMLDHCAATHAERYAAALTWLAQHRASEPLQRPWDRRGFKVPSGALYSATATFQKLALVTARAAASDDTRRALRHAVLACIAESSLLGMDAALNAECRRYAKLGA